MIFDPKTLPDYAARLEAVRLHDAFMLAENAYQEFVEADNAGDLSIAAQDALEVYGAHGVDLLIDDSNQVIRCALTGIPLLAEASDTVWVLAAAIDLKRGMDEDLLDRLAAAEAS